MKNPYIDLVVRELGSGLVKKVIEFSPTMPSNSHFMNVVLDYGNRQTQYPLNKEEYEEASKRYKRMEGVEVQQGSKKYA